MKKFTAILIIILLLSLIVGVYIYLNPKTPVEKRTIFAFDTVINLTISAKDAERVTDECEKEIYRLDKLFNVHNPQSEISLVNEKSGAYPVKVSQELFGVIERSVKYSEDTHGAFDITIRPLSDLWDIKSENPSVPSEDKIKEALGKVSYQNIALYPDGSIGFSSPHTRIDLGGVAKGYAADRLCHIIKSHNADYALIDLGGNIYCVGDREFSVGIQHPDKERGEYFRLIKAKDISVVTGGGYERGFRKDGIYYHHIISPYDGYPAESGLGSVTVVGGSSEMCDAYATAVYVYGQKLAEELCDKNPDISFIIMDKSGNVNEINR